MGGWEDGLGAVGGWVGGWVGLTVLELLEHAVLVFSGEEDDVELGAYLHEVAFLFLFVWGRGWVGGWSVLGGGGGRGGGGGGGVKPFPSFPLRERKTYHCVPHGLVQGHGAGRVHLPAVGWLLLAGADHLWSV